MPDWKKLLADQLIRKHSKDPNRQWATYSKQGWEKAEKIAEELDCSIPQISAVLRDSISDKRIERGEFQIWNRDLLTLEKIVGFRKVKPGQAAPAKKSKAPVAKPAVGMAVRSRRGHRGKILSLSRGKCEIEWETGTITRPAITGFKRRDIILEG